MHCNCCSRRVWEDATTAAAALTRDAWSGEGRQLKRGRLPVVLRIARYELFSAKRVGHGERSEGVVTML